MACPTRGPPSLSAFASINNDRQLKAQAIVKHTRGLFEDTSLPHLDRAFAILTAVRPYFHRPDRCPTLLCLTGIQWDLYTSQLHDITDESEMKANAAVWRAQFLSVVIGDQGVTSNAADGAKRTK